MSADGKAHTVVLGGDREAFRRSCFEAFWLWLSEQPGGSRTFAPGELGAAPRGALIARSDKPDGSVTFYAGGDAALPVPHEGETP